MENETKELMERVEAAKARVAAAKAAITEAEAKAAARVEEKGRRGEAKRNKIWKETGCMALYDFAKRPLKILDKTYSRARFDSDFKPAKYAELDTVPSVLLPDDFWWKWIQYNPNQRSFFSELDASRYNVELITAITNGLGIDCRIAPQVQQMDIEPDLSLFLQENMLPFLNLGGMKGIGDERWSNDSAVAGQIFEQLMLTKVAIGGAAYGIQSTYNAVRLISTDDWSDHPMLIPSLLRQNATTQALQASMVPNHAPKQPKATRVTALNVDRKFYVSKVYELGTKGSPDMEEKNKAVIQLISIALLLAHESTMHPLPNLRDVPFAGVCRTFSLGGECQIYPDAVQIDGGIRFDRCPSAQHTDFYALTQLRRGGTAPSFFAVASDASVCVLKIFLNTASKEAATVELEHWKTIYADREWTFMRLAEVAGILVLVLPFFFVPRNKEQRARMLKGEAPQDTRLWKALDDFASKGYTHNDLKWDHIGSLTSVTAKRLRDASEREMKRTETFLVDFGNIYKNDLMKDPSKRALWVRAHFDLLNEQHMNDTMPYSLKVPKEHELDADLD